MKLTANCLAILVLLLWGSQAKSTARKTASTIVQSPDTILPSPSPLLTSADSIQSISLPESPNNQPTPLDLNSEEEARLGVHLLDDHDFTDPDATLGGIDERRAAVPGVDQSMAGIFKDIVGHLKQINCQHTPANKNAERTFIKTLIEQSPTAIDPYSLCDEDIAPVVFMPLGDSKSGKTALFRHFQENIYQPLGYEMPAHRFSYADTISDLINLDPDNSVIHKNMHGLNFGNFSGMIGHAFESVESAATDFDRNKGLISKQMIDILKSFHIFWNVLRQKNQIGQTKSQTVAIIKQLMGKFRATNSAMKATTLNILENVKEAYFRFMRAHKYQKLISRKPLETIAFQLLERFKANVVKIRERQTDTFSFVSEIAVFLDMLRAFHTINKERGMTPQESESLFESLIAQPITNTYNVFQDVMVQNNDDSFFRVREFTATLLLKMKHRNHVIIHFFGWNDYFKARISAESRLFDNVVKFYEELVDAVMLIPSTCQEYTDVSLETCFKDRLDADLSEYSKKYMLEASVSGISLFRYVQQALDKVSAEVVGAGDSGDINAFKGVFVTKMSSMFKQFRLDYHINDMSEVEELENNIGFQIEKVKAAYALSPVNMALTDAFDKALYAFFLDIKSSYNGYAPVGKDQRIINSIAQKLVATVSNFKIDHAKQVTPETGRLMEVAVRQSKLWARRHSIQYVVNTHPVNVRVESVSPLADAVLNRMNVNDITLNTPFLGSSAIDNMGQQAAEYSAQMGNQSMTKKLNRRRVV
jgi:hypothetical protein